MDQEQRETKRRETRRERRERLRRENLTPPAPIRGRRRFAPKVVGFATATLLLAAGVSGAAYAIDQNTPYAIDPQDEISLVENAISAEGITFDPHEQEIWKQATIGSALLSPADPNTYQGYKLGYVRDAMKNSHNPYFTETIKNMEQLTEEGTLQIKVSPGTGVENTHAVAVTETHYIEASGKPTFVLRIPINTIRNASPLQIALLMVHEYRHIEQNLDFDRTHQHLPPHERVKALNKILNSEKNVEYEAEAYTPQLRAYVIARGQTTLTNLQSTEPKMAAQLIKNGNDSKRQKFLSYVRDHLKGRFFP